jgi:hypothetical protein
MIRFDTRLQQAFLAEYQEGLYICLYSSMKDLLSQDLLTSLAGEGVLQVFRVNHWGLQKVDRQ